MVDETTDSSNKELTAFYIRWVDQKFEAHEEFIGHCQLISGTSTESVITMIHDVML